MVTPTGSVVAYTYFRIPRADPVVPNVIPLVGVGVQPTGTGTGFTEVQKLGGTAGQMVCMVTPVGQA